MKRNILYTAYLYPPVGGLGLPGAQRIVKFVRNLECSSAHVLTVKTECYHSYALLDNEVKLPVNRESIYRTNVFDVFDILLKIKKIFLGKKKSGRSHTSNKGTETSLGKSSDIWYEHRSRSLWQKLKDFISDVFCFPDSSSSWIIPAVYNGLKIVKKQGITVIFATGSPWSALTVAYMINKFSGVPFVADFRDPWLDNPFHVSKGKLLDGLSVKLERVIIRSASIVSANTEELRESFLKRYPEIKPDKFITLPNGYDVSDYRHISSLSESETGVDKREQLVLAHAGFLYGTRDPSPIIHAIKKLSNSENGYGDIIFMQIGKISLNYDFNEKFKDLLADKKIILIDQLPYQECLQKLIKADVLLNIQPKTMTQVPSKIYDYVCLNLPILTITPLDGALGNMIKRYGLGYIFAPDDVDGISSCLLELLETKQRNGKLTMEYENKDVFDIKKIANTLSERLTSIGL
ncbi:MAG: hypothetical protein AMK71_00320 [Nitrospira bacterium SG8_35_4]|nr:MAG: hypothetical protein AMK71_00320 [Nitrospira bacterium SG8_35_4]